MLKRLALLGSVLAVLVGCAASPPPRAGTPSLAFAAEVPPDSFAPVAACNGLDATEVRGGFFRDGRRAASVERLYGEQRVGARNVIQKPVGARVVIRATPAVSGPWLERVAHCHAEMYRATGIEAGDEPLSVRGAVISVAPVHAGYAIDIRTDNRDDAEVIYERAQRAW